MYKHADGGGKLRFNLVYQHCMYRNLIVVALKNTRNLFVLRKRVVIEFGI